VTKERNLLREQASGTSKDDRYYNTSMNKTGKRGKGQENAQKTAKFKDQVRIGKKNECRQMN
jgi:hypothetical protein